MSSPYTGNYSFVINDLEDNSKKRYELAVQKGKPILDKELSEIAFRDLNLLRNFLMNNVGDGAIGTAFKIVESTISNINNFKITGGTATNPAILVVKGYPLVLWGDIEFNQQGVTSGDLKNDAYTKSTIIPINTPLGVRTDEVYVDTYLAEVSSEIGSEYQDASIKDPTLALPTANRFRIVQDIQVAEGGVTPADGNDVNGIYHRYYKLATINRLAGDATVTAAMITDNRTVINSLKSYQDGTAGSIRLTTGSNIGDDTHRISQIFMASTIDYKTNDLVFKNNGSETVRITTGGKIGIGSATPNDFITIFTSANPFINLISTGSDSTSGISVKNDARQWIVKVAGDQSDNFVIRDVTAGGDRLVVTNAGYVGVGKTNPSVMLDVAGAVTVGNNLTVNGTTTTVNTEITTTDKFEVDQAANQEALIINKSGTGVGTALKINNAGTGPTIWAGTGAGTNYFLITSGGLVGIGSTNPQSKLEVFTTSEPALNINRSAASSSNAVATFMNGVTELARVSLNGRVGIASAVPAASLDVNGDARIASRMGIAGDPNASYSLYINGPTLSKRIDINPDFNSFTSSSYSTIASVDNNTGSYPFTAVGNLVVKTRSDGNNRDIVFVTGSNAVRMVISGAGKIGIGATEFTSEGEITRIHTDTNSTILRLDWQDTVSNTNSASIRFGRSGWTSTAYVRGQADGTGTINGGLVFGVYPKGDAVSILQNGKVGIGTAAQQLLELYEDPATLEFRKKTAGPVTDNGIGAIHWTAKTPDGNDHTAGQISVNAENTWVNGSNYNTYLAFSNSYGSTTGIERMRISASGSVGIGTTNPNTRLSVIDTISTVTTNLASSSAIGEFKNISNVTGTWSLIDIRTNDSTNTGEVFGRFGTYNSNTTNGAESADFAIGLVSSGSLGEKFRIKATGEVGIGLTNPYTKLHIHGNGGLRISDIATAVTTAAGGTANSFINNYDSGTCLYLKPTGASGGDHVAIDTSAGAPVFYVKGNNKIGIGTINPKGSGLHIWSGDSGLSAVSSSADNFIIEESGNGGMTILSPTNGFGSIFFGDSGGQRQGQIQYNHSTDSLTFATSGSATPTIIINASGNVGVGTTNVIAGLDSWQPIGTQGAGRFVVTGTGAAPAAPVLQVLSDYSSLTTPLFRINANGNVGLGTTNPARNFHINGETLGFYSGSTENVTLWGQTGLFSIDIAGDTKVRVNSSGKVGIGTTNILANVDSWGTIGAQGAGRFVITGAGSLPAAPVFQALSDYSSLALPLFRINANGNVGLGTTNPSSKLYVSGDISTGDVGVKWKALTGLTSPATTADTAYAHGIASGKTKILSITVSIEHTNGYRYTQGMGTTANSYYFAARYDDDNVNIFDTQGLVANRDMKIFITYLA